MTLKRRNALEGLIELADALLDDPISRLDPEACLERVAGYARRREALLEDLGGGPFDAAERALGSALLERDAAVEGHIAKASARWRAPLEEARARQSALNNYRAPEAAHRTFHLKG